MNDKYIFVFAGSWNEFRNWMRETGLEDTFLNEDEKHIVYVDRPDKWRGYGWNIYANAEVRVIGTFWDKASSDQIREMSTLEERIRIAIAKP